MPTGIPNSGKRRRSPKGINLKKLTGSPSEQTQRLLQALQDIEDRLQVERAKDRARAGILAFAAKHDLSASDLRDAARIIGARETGDEPAIAKGFGKAKRMAVGKKLRDARIAKGINGAALGKLVGAKGTAAVAQWERGMLPSLPKYRAALIKHLDLPKNFFDVVPSTMLNAPPPRATNGAAH